MGISTLTVMVDAGVSMNNPFYCYISDPIRSSVTMHGNFTAYEPIRHFNIPPLNPYTSSCTTSRFWYLGNHGNRMARESMFLSMLEFAESPIQADIVRNYEAGRTTLCRQDFEAIRDWTVNPNFVIENAELITEAGKVVMQNFARRYQQMFPNILTEAYSPQRFHFRHEALQRSNTPIRAFASGLFGESGSQNIIYEDVPDVDWLLRPFDYCRAHREQVERTERDAFKKGPEIEQMLNEINRRLGFRGSNQLDFDTSWRMWRWCTVETQETFEISNSTIGDDSIWCAAFTVDHYLLLQYDTVMVRCYTYGNGFRDQRFLTNLQCDILQD